MKNSYALWYDGGKDTIQDKVNRAIAHYKNKDVVILAVEVSNKNLEKKYTLGEIKVVPVREVPNNHILLELENHVNGEETNRRENI